MAKLNTIALSDTFGTWLTGANESYARINQFAVNESSLYANTFSANVALQVNTIRQRIAGPITINANTNFVGTFANVTATNTNITGGSLLVSSNVNFTGAGLQIQGGEIDLYTDTGSPAWLKFYCETNNAHGVKLQGPTHAEAGGATNRTLVIPAANGYLMWASAADDSRQTISSNVHFSGANVHFDGANVMYKGQLLDTRYANTTNLALRQTIAVERAALANTNTYVATKANTAGGIFSGQVTVANTLTVLGTSSGSGTDPQFIIKRDDANPLSNDWIGKLRFDGKDDDDNDTTYAAMGVRVHDVSDGSEDAHLSLYVMGSGTADAGNWFFGKDHAQAIQFATSGYIGTDEYDRYDTIRVAHDNGKSVTIRWDLFANTITLTGKGDIESRYSNTAQLANTNSYIAGVQTALDTQEAKQASNLANTNSYIAGVSTTASAALPKAGGTMTGTLQVNAALNTNNDIKITAGGNRYVGIESTNGLATMEIGGATGAFIDLKHPYSDDFDMRIGTSTDGGYINTARADLAISANTQFTGNHVGHNDNTKTYWGTGDDLEIYHDASNSYIKDTGTGALISWASANYIRGSSGEDMIKATTGGAVEAYFSNSKKFETTTNGVTVTGVATTTQSNSAIYTNQAATGSVTLDFTTYTHFHLKLTGNLTLANPTTEISGSSGLIWLKQDTTGSRTLSLGTDYETPASAGHTLSTAANSIDVIPYYVVQGGSIVLGQVQRAFG